MIFHYSATERNNIATCSINHLRADDAVLGIKVCRINLVEPSTEPLEAQTAWASLHVL